MRVAVIYRPRQAPPPDQLPAMFQGLAEWVQRYRGRMESLNFFVGGGGFGVLDMDDSAELHRMLAEHPFTPFADVEVRPVVDAETALTVLQEVFA
ncbi:MAG TPA: DUF3303 family protein [Solirubrobacteraceae bacterium]|nr:DUF3303 family protein [Solirubrobacteraceae bacterium]